MPVEDYNALTPRLQGAVDELQHLIRRVDPLATFQVVPGDDPTGTYVLPTVDVEDTELVMDAYMDRLLTLQIDEGLPIHVAAFTLTHAGRAALTSCPGVARRCRRPSHGYPAMPSR